METAQVQTFILFGEQHCFAMLITVILVIAFPLTIKKFNSQHLMDTLAITLAVLILLSKVGEPVYRMFAQCAWRTNLPLQLCDMGGIAAGIMLFNRNSFFYDLSYFWGFGGGVQAILTPDLQYGFPDIDFLLFFVTHGLCLLGITYAALLFKMRPTVQSIWRIFAVTLIYGIFILIINWLLNTNYLYLCSKPENPSLLDYLGPWPWYLISLAGISLVLFVVYYSPFFTADLIRKRK